MEKDRQTGRQRKGGGRDSKRPQLPAPESKKEEKAEEEDIRAMLLRIEGGKDQKNKGEEEEEMDDDDDDDDNDDGGWEEVADDPSNLASTSSRKPGESIEITLEPNQLIKKRKKKRCGHEEFQAALRRMFNNFQRDLRIYTHKVHLLCGICHGMHLNRICNDATVQALGLSVVPAWSGDRRRGTMEDVRELITHFSNTIKLPRQPEDDPKKKEEEDICCTAVIQAFSLHTASTDKELVLMLIASLRSVGLRVRIVLSLQPLPLKATKDTTTKNTAPKKTSKGKPSSASTTSSTTKTSKVKSSSSATAAKAKVKVEAETKPAKVKLETKPIEVKGETNLKVKDETKVKVEGETRPGKVKGESNVKVEGETKVTDTASTNKAKVKAKRKTKVCEEESEVPQTGRPSRPSRRSSKAPPSYRDIDTDDEDDDGDEEKEMGGEVKKRKKTMHAGKKSRVKLEEEEEEDEEVEKKDLSSSSNDFVEGSTVARHYNNNNNGRKSVKRARAKKKNDEEEKDEEWVKGKRGTNSHRLISSSSSDNSFCSAKNDVEVWIEVYIENESRWVSVDCINNVCDDVRHFETMSRKPLVYVLAFDNDGHLKDLTARYSAEFLVKTRKFRVDAEWWGETLGPYLNSSEEDVREDQRIKGELLNQPLPKTISEFKDHPLYALRRHLLKFEAIYPNSSVPLGFIRNEPVYARECVVQLHSRETWMKEGRCVKIGEEPYKMVKSRPKWNKPKENPDVPDLEVFGLWQTEIYIPPPAVDGKVPRNAYGNVELFKAHMLPAGTVHLTEPALNRVAKKLGIDCAAAMVGWDFHGGSSHPVFDGWVVCVEHKDKVLAEWKKEQQLAKERETAKREKRIYGNWRKLIRGLRIREALKRKYGTQDSEDFQDTTTTTVPNTATATATTAAEDDDDDEEVDYYSDEHDDDDDVDDDDDDDDVDDDDDDDDEDFVMEVTKEEKKKAKRKMEGEPKGRKLPRIKQKTTKTPTKTTTKPTRKTTTKATKTPATKPITKTTKPTRKTTKPTTKPITKPTRKTTTTKAKTNKKK